MSLNQAADVAALVRAAQAGDRRAFGELYVRYAGMVHAIALGRVPARDAEDVVQDAFLRAMRKLRTMRDPQAFGAWIAKITRNVALNAARQGSELSDAEPDKPVAGTQHDAMEARRALAAIRSLPRAYRETLMMRLVQGMTGPEIADRTGLSPPSVRVNLHRGMKLLRKKLETKTEKKRSR